MSLIKNHREQLLPKCGYEKALRKQGSPTLAKTPTSVAKEVVGDYTRWADIAIGCVQFVDGEPVNASLRFGLTRQCEGLRASIGGRDGRAECFLMSLKQVDEVIERLEILKVMQFGGQGAIE